MNIKKFLSSLGKNILALIIGAGLGIICSLLYGWNFWLPSRMSSLPSGFGAFFGGLALIVISIILFSAIGAIVGAISGLICFQIIGLFRKVKPTIKS